MLGASVDILDQLLELSVTGDTAKYLVLTLQRLCTFTIRLNQPKLSPHSNSDRGKEEG